MMCAKVLNMDERMARASVTAGADIDAGGTPKLARWRVLSSVALKLLVMITMAPEGKKCDAVPHVSTSSAPKSVNLAAATFHEEGRENKLPVGSIRQLTHRHEMHMVNVVESIGLPDGPMDVVRLRRARGDRNHTETCRFAHFYRQLIARSQRYTVTLCH